MADSLGTRQNRRLRGHVTKNACTNCRKKRVKCDGMLPCSHCDIDDESAKGEPCNYVVHSQVAKGEMKTTIDDLQERDRISALVFQALASSSQAPSILQSLQDGEDLSTIAYGIEAGSPNATVSSLPAQRRSSTCDACKFRRQYCDGTKPACRTCQTRRLSCKYTNTPASVVVQPSLLVDTSSNSQGGSVGRGLTWQRYEGGSGQPSPSGTDVSQLPERTRKQRHSASQHSRRFEEGHLSARSLTEDVECLLTEACRDDLPTYSPTISLPSDRTRLHHVQALNPFDHYSASTIKPFLSLFLDRVNSVFYFFDESTLEKHFSVVLESTNALTNETMSELCLVLALGAQISNGGNDDKTIVWYENGRRYLDDENWGNELWIMRATSLISLYHVGERPNTARHYLAIAMDIGRSYFLDHPTTSELPGGEGLDWLRVWTSVLFLHNWLSLPLGLDSAKEVDHSVNRIPDELGQLLGYSTWELTTDQNMFRLLNNYCHIIEKVYGAPSVPISQYESCMNDLSVLAISFPKWFDHTNTTQMEGMDDQMRISLVHLQSMRLGSIIALTRPLLLQTTSAYVRPSAEPATLEFGVKEFGQICLNAAADLAHLCLTLVEMGSFPERCWLPIHLLYEAALVSTLGVIYRRAQVESGKDECSDVNLQRPTAALDAAISVFAYCAVANGTAQEYWQILVQFKQTYEQLLG